MVLRIADDDDFKNGRKRSKDFVAIENNRFVFEEEKLFWSGAFHACSPAAGKEDHADFRRGGGHRKDKKIGRIRSSIFCLR